jgi:hypothetical protein
MWYGVIGGYAGTAIAAKIEAYRVIEATGGAILHSYVILNVGMIGKAKPNEIMRSSCGSLES